MPRKPAPAVFISYSHQDEAWKDRLVKHLAVLETEGLLVVWSDQRIGAGGDWRREIDEALASARVAVLLVTADFLISPFIREVEVPEMLRRREEEGLYVFPVIATSCAWKQVAFLKPIQARPRNDRALASFGGDRKNAQLAAIAEEILGLAKRAEGDATSPQPGSAPARGRPRERPADSAPPAAPEIAGPGRPEAPLSPPALHQLPSPPADFVGREAELAELRAAVAKGRQVAIFGLRGIGGIGKTTFAVKLAEELALLYPDAQLFLDLQGVTNPLSAAQAMAHVIRSFHPDVRVPEDGAELAGLYRSVLHGKRVLLLMDNAAGKEQVEPLIPPAGCALLVTSRIHFRLPGARTRDLDKLPEADSRALLRGVAASLGEAEAGEIARLCGYLPFALRLAGSALADRPDLSPADYARGLKQAKRRFGPVDASLKSSVELLREELREQWCRLAVFPATFDAEAAAAVWALGARARKTDAAREALGELVTSSLVEWEAVRYRLHDLARLFALGRLEDRDLLEAQRRHAAHYLEVLRSADSLYEQGGPAILEGLRLFDAEWHNTQAGQAWAAANAASDPEAAHLCDAYPDAGAYCLSLRRPPRERIRWLEAALEAARTREDRNAQAAHLGNLGVAYADLGEPSRAIDFYGQQLAIARQLGDRLVEGSALGNLGSAHSDLGKPRRAIDFCEEQLAIARQLGDRRGEGNALNNLGLAYADLGKPRHAIDLYQLQLAIAREFGDRHSEADALWGLGNIYADLGKPRRAIKLFEQQLALARQLGDWGGEGDALGNLGHAYAALGESRRAIELFEQQLAIARQLGDSGGEGDALGNLGNTHADLGEPPRAVELFEQQLAIARELGDQAGEARAGWNLGLALEKIGDLARAAGLMQILVDYERKIGHPDAEQDAAQLEAIRSRISGSPARKGRKRGGSSPRGGRVALAARR